MRCSPPGSRLSTEASGTWCRCKPSFSPSSTLQPTQSTVHSVHIKLLQLTQVNKLTAHYCTSLCTLLYNYIPHTQLTITLCLYPMHINALHALFTQVTKTHLLYNNAQCTLHHCTMYIATCSNTAPATSFRCGGCTRQLRRYDGVLHPAVSTIPSTLHLPGCRLFQE